MADVVDCPALHIRHVDKGYPYGDKVPKTIMMRQQVQADFVPGIGRWSDAVAEDAAVYPAWTNSYGAVCAVLEDGKRLGLKPEEFVVVGWYDVSLIGRLSVAVGPDRELDVAVHEASGLPWPTSYISGYAEERMRDHSKVPAYTASLDAAVALIETLIPGGRHANGRRWDGVCFASVGFARGEGTADIVKDASTEPLALLTALFTSLERKV